MSNKKEIYSVVFRGWKLGILFFLPNRVPIGSLNPQRFDNKRSLIVNENGEE